MPMQRRPMVDGACALLLGLGLIACGGGTPSADAVAAKRDAAWAELDQEHQGLEQQRAELARLAAAGGSGAAASGEAAGGAAPGEGGEGGGTAGEGAAERLEALETEVEEASQAFNERLVAFINDNPPVVGEPLTPVQQAAIRMKSDEDILVAREFIDKGGDYRRAVKIYETALMADPDYDRLKQELARAEEMRFMTEERFALVKDGMTEDEVRTLLGPVNLRNVRHFEKENVVAWYYPKNEHGAAAAVWFRHDAKKKALAVYQADFDAIAEGGGGEGDA
jgi:hypothetical protein